MRAHDTNLWRKTRPLRNRLTARCRRHGRSVSGTRHEARPRGRDLTKGKPMKNTAKKKLAKNRGTAKKQLAKKKPLWKRVAVKTKTLGKKTTGAKTLAA